MTPTYKEEEGKMLVNIEVDCECEGVACAHMISEVQKAVQQAYNNGVKDGATSAMENVTDFLQKHYPREYAEAEKQIKAERSTEKLN
jgi:hypothetical protein